LFQKPVISIAADDELKAIGGIILNSIAIISPIIDSNQPKKCKGDN
jgi:hypothetical protein